MDGRDDWDDQDDLEDNTQLDPADTLERDPHDPGADPLDEGYSPVERPWVVDGRAEEHEDLGRRLEREVPEVPLDEGSDYTDDSKKGVPDFDAIGDTAETDGELRDDELRDGEAGDGEVGDVRAGRLVADAADPDAGAVDVGIDGAGSSAEEAAVHRVPADSDH